MNVPYIAKKMGEFIKEGKNSPEIVALCDEIRVKSGSFVSNLFYRIAYSITYTKEPEGSDVWQTPRQTLKGSGDCEDIAIVLACAAVHEKIPCMVKFVAIDGDVLNHVYPLMYDEASDAWLALDATPNHNARLDFEAPYKFAELYRVDGGVWPVGREISIVEPSTLVVVFLFVTLLIIIGFLRLIFRG